MNDATCKTCPWWNCVTTGAAIQTRGECRFRAPKIHDGPRWPDSGEDDWCSKHPDRQPHLECGVTAVMGRETFPAESDMRRIVDALEKMASRAQRATP